MRIAAMGEQLSGESRYRRNTRQHKVADAGPFRRRTFTSGQRVYERHERRTREKERAERAKMNSRSRWCGTVRFVTLL